MRRLYTILLALFFVFFVTLVLYAFVEPVRAWMKATIAPPLTGAFGGLANAITSSPIWQNWIVPFPNQLLIGAIALGFPIAWLWHKSFNRVRTRFVRSAARDSGMYPTMTEPVSTPASAPQPTPTTTSPSVAAIEAEVDKVLAEEPKK